MAAENAISFSAAPSAGFAMRVADIGFVAFLLLIFVGLTPFAPRDASLLVGAASANAGGAGDTLRQFCFALAFTLIVFAAVHEKGVQAFAIVPPVLAVLLLWCAASAAWSAEPAIALRRAGLAAVIVLSGLLSVSTLGPQRSFQILRWVLVAILVVNWCSIPFVHQAVHLAGDPEPQLVGDWRGLYFHKNIAGAVSAITALVFFFSAWSRRSLLDAAICAAAIGFAIMTRSKSSLLLLPLAILAGAVYQIAWRRALDRAIAIVVLGLIVMGAAAFMLIDQSAVAHAFTDPEGFTGRAEIWHAELAFIRDHPYLGAGFGSFADTGTLSPLRDYMTNNWLGAVAHGHNAYLQLFVTIGGVGLVLALVALIVQPMWAFWRGGNGDTAQWAMLFAIFVFVALHNFLESDFLEGDDPAWVAFLLMLGALYVPEMTARRETATAP